MSTDSDSQPETAEGNVDLDRFHLLCETTRQFIGEHVEHGELEVVAIALSVAYRAADSLLSGERTVDIWLDQQRIVEMIGFLHDMVEMVAPHDATLVAGPTRLQ
jgi:hypothetical protein|tara:strand:+ start:464 stop:775 length:312 start_codon:yes stop_codon:yes gene_type:complete